MSTVSQTLEKASTGEASRPKGASWLRRVFNKCLDASGLRAPVGYEDETGFHYGTMPLAEQEAIARQNMSKGEPAASSVPPASTVTSDNSTITAPTAPFDR